MKHATTRNAASRARSGLLINHVFVLKLFFIIIFIYNIISFFSSPNRSYEKLQMKYKIHLSKGYVSSMKCVLASVQFSSVAQLCPTLRPHELQHARPPCPSPTPRVHSDSRPSSQ